MGATGCARGGWRSCGRSASSFCVVTCAVNSCATRCSISPLLYPQLLATKEITSRHPVGLRIEHVNSSVKRCRIVKDCIRLWKQGIRDLVMALCCALHNFRVRLTPWQPMIESGYIQMILVVKTHHDACSRRAFWP